MEKGIEIPKNIEQSAAQPEKVIEKEAKSFEVKTPTENIEAQKDILTKAYSDNKAASSSTVASDVTDKDEKELNMLVKEASAIGIEKPLKEAKKKGIWAIDFLHDKLTGKGREKK